MTLEEFAKLAGIKIIECDRDKWGGGFGYTEEDEKISVCGLRTEKEAYKEWLKATFGEKTSKIIIKLLKEHKE